MNEADENGISEAESEQYDHLSDGLRRRHANVYDAVAGRVSTRSFRDQPSDHENASSTRSFPAVPPEEVLFRRLNAPVRYMEDDFYFANKDLPVNQPLPDSDLLKAIHTYTSDLYSNATIDRGESTWRSMDETALIALGILLEETANEALEETGDMVFVEGEQVTSSEDGLSSRRASVSTTASQVPIRAYGADSSGFDGTEDELIASRQRPRSKRRRLNNESIIIPDSSGAVT